MPSCWRHRRVLTRDFWPSALRGLLQRASGTQCTLTRRPRGAGVVRRAWPPTRVARYALRQPRVGVPLRGPAGGAGRARRGGRAGGGRILLARCAAAVLLPCHCVPASAGSLQRCCALTRLRGRFPRAPDVFVAFQHRTRALPLDWWSKTFRRSVADIGTTLLVLQPWGAPLPLTRSWCLWEIFCTVDCGAQLRIALSPEQSAELRDALVRYRPASGAACPVCVALSLAALRAGALTLRCAARLPHRRTDLTTLRAR
jgi:hypothetical protein